MRAFKSNENIHKKEGGSYYVCMYYMNLIHWCEVPVEKSVPRVTVWHHEALPSDAKQ